MSWDKVLKMLAGLGGAIWGLFGGKDTMLMVLLGLMLIDYVTGFAVGFVGKSRKTETGHLSSSVSRDGIIKKMGEMVAVIVGVLLDLLAVEYMGLPGAAFRTGIILYIVATEGISVLENLGLLGVPMPAFVKKALEQLQKKNDEPINILTDDGSTELPMEAEDEPSGDVDESDP